MPSNAWRELFFAAVSGGPPVAALAIFCSKSTRAASRLTIVTGGVGSSLGKGLAAAMTCLAVFAVFVRLDIVQFLEAYVAIYICSAIVGVVLMIRGPFRLAHEVAGLPEAAPHQLSGESAVPTSR